MVIDFLEHMSRAQKRGSRAVGTPEGGQAFPGGTRFGGGAVVHMKLTILSQHALPRRCLPTFVCAPV